MKEHGIRRRDRGFGLRLHAAGQAVRRGLIEAGGVDHREGEIAEPRTALAAVARDAGPVIDQRQPPADQPIEQRRLADIRPSDNGDREGHEGKAWSLSRAMDRRVLILSAASAPAGQAT